MHDRPRLTIALTTFSQHWATAEGLRLRSENQNDRPFVLSRAFFAGTQRCTHALSHESSHDQKNLTSPCPTPPPQ